MNKDTLYEYPSIHHRLLGYPYRVWIFTILITPLLSSLWVLVFGKEIFEFSVWSILIYLFAVAVLTAFSTPAMFVFMLLFWKLVDSKLPVPITKLILFITASGSILLTGCLLTGNPLLQLFSFNNQNIDLSIFLFVFFVLSLVFKLK